MPTYETETQIWDIVAGFESCTTDKAAFKHLDHLTVAVCYLESLTVEQATVRMRDSLLRFVDHHQVDRRKYNETITVFWLQIVADELTKFPATYSLVEKCNGVVEALNDARLPFEYYSTELLFSDGARQFFVVPDLKEWRRS